MRTRDQFPRDFQQTQSNLGHLHFGERQWTEALAAYRQAIGAERRLLADAYTDAGRRAETAETSTVYARAAYALAKLGRCGEAFVKLEQGKARLLSQALALAEMDLSRLPSEQQQTLRSLRQQIRELEYEMSLPADTPARRDERTLAAALAQARARLQEAIAAARRNDPDLLPEGLDLAEILVLIPRRAVLVAPVVTAQGGAVFVVPAEVQSLSAEHMLWLDDFREADLHTLLQGPAPEAQLGGWFGAYFASRTDRGSWLRTNEEATAAALKKRRASYLHFSCHGFYRWDDPLQSGLILARGEPFTLAQVLGELKLDTCRLVALSACETGITEVRQSPDEYLGLPAGFLQAGAPAVLSTLWPVNDLSTMLLIERFYQRHLQAGEDFPSALRHAQRWLRSVTAGDLAQRFADEEEALLTAGTRMPIEAASDYFLRFAAQDPTQCPFAHPYYWAAFTFAGA